MASRYTVAQYCRELYYTPVRFKLGSVVLKTNSDEWVFLSEKKKSAGKYSANVWQRGFHSLRFRLL